MWAGLLNNTPHTGDQTSTLCVPILLTERRFAATQFGRSIKFRGTLVSGVRTELFFSSGRWQLVKKLAIGQEN